MRKIIGIILLILAVAMLYLGIINQMLPPSLTGIGFAAIGILFLWEDKIR
jgi:hypothetical protein